MSNKLKGGDIVGAVKKILAGKNKITINNLLAAGVEPDAEIVVFGDTIAYCERCNGASIQGFKRKEIVSVQEKDGKQWVKVKVL